LGELRKLTAVRLKLFEFLQSPERGLVALDVIGVVLEVLELAGRVVGLEAFEKLFGLDELGGDFFNLRLAEEV